LPYRPIPEWSRPFFCSSHNGILLHDLPIFVDRPSFLAAAQGYAAVPAAGLFSCCLGSFEGFFGILEIVGDHGGKATEQPCQNLSRPIRIVYFNAVAHPYPQRTANPSSDYWRTSILRRRLPHISKRAFNTPECDAFGFLQDNSFLYIPYLPNNQSHSL